MSQQEAIKNRWIWAKASEEDSKELGDGADILVITNERYFKKYGCIYDGRVGDLLDLEFDEFDEIMEGYFLLEISLDEAKKTMNELGIEHSAELEKWLEEHPSGNEMSVEDGS
jgi:hypothetical protein